MIRRALSGSALLLVAGCSGAPSREVADPRTREETAMNQQIAGDMTAVRLQAAEARIVQLERQVGEMQARPEKIDLQLLTQRLEAVEARVYARTDDPAPAPSPRPSPRRPEPVPTASPTSRFNPFGL